MGRVRQGRKKFRDWSLRPAFWAYTLVAFGLATLVCALCITGLENLRMHSYAREYWEGYQEYEIPAGGSYEMWSDEDGVHYRIFNAGGAEVALAEGDGVTARVTLGYMGEVAGDEEEPNLIAVVPLMDEQQRTVSVLLTVASILCFPICYGGGAALCAALFYRRKLKGPIALLDMASRKIAEKDLDFAIHWDRRDEMGALCASFEEMRRALWENNRVMWRQMEERKRLNAAFAHDLRTPLTVLSGYTGMLRRDLAEGTTPADMAQEVDVMEAQVRRLEDYVQAMSSLQRLEDQPVRRAWVRFSDLRAQMESEMDILLAGRQTVLDAPGEGGAALDAERVMQVFENLVSNAARFAAARVEATVEWDGNRLVLSVKDDGPGFTPEGLRRAAEPFYRGDGPDAQGHLGLGLNICRVLCEACGGGLEIANGHEGGARVRAWFGA
ncbi:MAG TPA: HAMP domain-containing histidine kinase [Candidatus Limiplasma pullicola]|nr:HAMP domain-containing histidine kinase [Candidatus Limiplasma pullicola]